MRQTALLVAHGQPSDPGPAEADLAALARRVGTQLPGWAVGSATLAAPGALEHALGAAEAPIVLPFFMADGWFVRSELPRRLASAGRPDARLLPPFGLLPETAGLATGLLGQALAERSWAAPDTRLLLAAHGSGRSPHPAAAARDMAATIAAALPFAEIRLGFIEEEPGLTFAARGLTGRTLCLPLFVAAWGHVATDIPEALAAADYTGALLPPLGAADGVPALLARRFTAAP